MLPIDLPKDLQAGWLAAGIVAAVLAWLQYLANNRWRRADSLAGLMKAWRENPINRNAMRMLDVLKIEHHGVRIDFGTAAEKYGVSRYLELTPELILSALYTPADCPGPEALGPEAWGRAQLIRETMEFFFNELSHMNRYIKDGLYPSWAIRPYLKWYLGVLGGSTRAATPETRERFRAYLVAWGFDDVLDLIARARREHWSRK
jgi:hypothetical protein